MKTKRDLKYYFKLYILILGVYAATTVILAAINDWEFLPTQLASVAYLPILFVLFLFVFNSFFDFFFKPKKQVEEDVFNNFAKNVVSKMNDDFTLEDYRRLQESDSFQKSLRHAYEITENGETRDMNLAFLQKKFKKDTLEGKALSIVLNEVKKMI